MKIYGETYGCTMNQGDTEMMLGELRDSGHSIVDSPDEANLVVLNTCAVTRTTLNRVIYRLKELKDRDDVKVVVAGCLPLIEPGKIEEIGEFDGVISCRTTGSISRVVERISRGESGIEIIEGESAKPTGKRVREGMSSPVPIAEGCMSDCSYCCVKFARGKLRSFDPEEIIEEIKGEVETGRKEIFVTAQDTGAYGLDIGTDLPSLLERIAAIPMQFRARIGMMNPGQARGIVPGLLDAYESEKIYKFLHVPVQSGSDRVLENMRRDYTVEDFREIVESFRNKFPDLYLSTDIIAGFPGEGEEDFEASLELMEDVGPDKINITRFTPMPGTDAMEMEQVDSEVKKERSRELTDLYRKIIREKNQRFVGEEREGLVVQKGEKGGYMVRLQSYRPVFVEDANPGEFVKVRITDAEGTHLEGEITEVKA